MESRDCHKLATILLTICEVQILSRIRYGTVPPRRCRAFSFIKERFDWYNLMRLVDVDQAIRLVRHLEATKGHYTMSCDTIIYFLNQLHARFPYDDVSRDCIEDADFDMGDLL